MKTHKLFLFIIILHLCLGNINAQLINCNPDPNGEPWWGGNMRITPEVIAKMQAIPIMTLSGTAIYKTLHC